MNHLFIALSTKGYGETALGIRVATELQERGDKCFFLAHQSAIPLLQSTTFPHMKTSDHAIGFLNLTLHTLIRKMKPDSIVLSDYFTTALAFEKAAIDPTFLKQLDISVGAIDTWDMEKSGSVIDVFGNEQREFQDWSDVLDYRLIPVPIARPDSGGPYYQCLPDPIQITKKVKRHIHRDLAIPPNGKVVLFCSGEWQHASFTSEHGNRLTRLLPKLVGQFLDKLGEDVFLVHVGPSSFANVMNDRYRWLPSLAPDQFDMLVASADVLLVANASSTTIAKALVTGIPAVVLMNSHAVTSVADIHSQNGAVSKELEAWISEAAPIYPFYMWPIGYYRFLKSLLDGNYFCDVVPMLEITNEHEVLRTLQSLLFEAGSRRDHIARQMQYVEQLRLLPKAASLIKQNGRA